MRVTIRTAVAAALVCTPWTMAAAQGAADTIATKQGGDLVIHPVHHGSFVMTWTNRAIYVDPAPAPGGDRDASAAAAFKGFPPPDILLVTDIHACRL